ncbi:MAG TPA: DUF1810 domain-containing protein [Devosiaceae bacterium]|jgi:uncharacterized protein (DUF1810 family)|nr:DUF1810 domain-containing protein [Devosiaceae bacterium]
MFGHFLEAQEPVYETVLAELRAGEKRTHWMWFIFPQLKGLGRSAAAERFGLADLAAARAYLAHDILGARLRECTGLVNAIGARAAEADIVAAKRAGDNSAVPRTAHEIFATPDDLKFRSSMTLFAHADAKEPLFREALDKYFGGRGDPLTEELLGRPAATSPAPPP